MNNISTYGFAYHLTIGKWYDILVDEEEGDHFKICNDVNEFSWYSKSLFKTDAVVREEALNKLGI